jgi:hypothetical protein
MRQTSIRSFMITAAGMILLAACGPKEEAGSTADTVAQNVQLPNTDTSLALADRPVSPAPTPAPAPAPRPSPPPPAPKPSPSPAPVPAPAPPPARPAARLAAGTTLEATATREITSKVNKAGEQFTARIASDVTAADGRVVIPAGSEIVLTISEIKPAPNKGAKDGTLVLAVTSVRINGETRPVDAEVTFVEHTLKGRGVGTGEAAKVGAGAAAGAIIGKVIGGGAGAAAGAVTGAAAGAAVAVETADRDVVIPEGGKIRIALKSPLIAD